MELAEWMHKGGKSAMVPAMVRAARASLGEASPRGVTNEGLLSKASSLDSRLRSLEASHAIGGVSPRSPVADAAPDYFDRVVAFKGSRSEVQDAYDELDRMGADYRQLVDDAVARHGLTPDEAHAVFGYTTKLFYSDLNKSLLGGGSQEAKDLAALIRSGMEKMPGSVVIQYRGWRLEPHQLADFDAKFSPGQVVETSFWSSSPSALSVYDTNRNAIIWTSAARDISDLAFGVHFHHLVGKPLYYSEALIPPGVQFDVLMNDPGGWIMLEQR